MVAVASKLRSKPKTHQPLPPLYPSHPSNPPSPPLSPPVDIFFGFPHVSIGESGEVGSLLRRGRGKPSSACGALIAIRNGIASGEGVTEDDKDREFVTLKKKIVAKVRRECVAEVA